MSDRYTAPYINFQGRAREAFEFYHAILGGTLSLFALDGRGALKAAGPTDVIAPIPDADESSQRAVVDAFFAAARAGDFEGLLALLDPEVVVRADLGPLNGGSREVRGARAVAAETIRFAQFTGYGRPALVNGTAGVVAAEPGRPYSVVGFTVRRGKVVEMDILADPARLQQLDLAGLDE